MEILATLEETTPVQSGTSKAGNNWKKTEAVVLTTGDYPKRFRLTCFNDICNQATAIPAGTLVHIRFSIEQREVPAKGERKSFWVNEVSCHGITPYQVQVNPQQSQPQQVQPQPASAGGYVQTTCSARPEYTEMPVQTNIAFTPQVPSANPVEGADDLPF